MEPALISGYPIILPEHRAVFHRERPDWHKHWLDSIHQSLKPDDVVIDVGAEQGDLSALIASWVPDGGIYLVEPVAEFWPTIKETFEANSLRRPWASLVGFAASVTDPWVKPYVGYWPEASWQLEPEPDPGFQHLNERPDLPRLRLDDWVDLKDVTALLVDVEGSELHVLKGAEYLLTESWPTVWCAIHPEIMHDRYQHDPNELMAFMYRLGYRWEFLGFQSELHFKFTPR